MKKRDFLKSMTFLGATTMVDYSMFGNILVDNEGNMVKDDKYLVAIMGGEPEAMLNRAFVEIGGIEKFVKKGMTVVLKPNIGWDKTPDMAANTNPKLVGAMVKKCLAAGAKEVQVFDHTCDNWVKCYENSGIKDAVEKAGGVMLPANDESYYVDYKLPKGLKLKETKLHKAIVNCDVWFNMPILKNHGGAKMSCSMKNLMGINWDRQTFHKNDLQQYIADLNTLEKKPVLHIVDAYRVMKQNGPQGKSGNDVSLVKSLIVSPDPVAADTAALKMLEQLRDMSNEPVTHIPKAEALNVGTTDLSSLKVTKVKL